MARREKLAVVLHDKDNLDVHVVELCDRIQCILEMQRIHNMDDDVGRCFEYRRYFGKYVESYRKAVA